VKAPLLALLVAALTGCSHASVRMSTDGSTSTTTTSVSAGYSGHGSAAMWVLIGIGLIAWEYGGSEGARERGLEPERKPPAPLDAGRQVNEVDCTKPIKDWSGNLKCK